MSPEQKDALLTSIKNCSDETRHRSLFERGVGLAAIAYAVAAFRAISSIEVATYESGATSTFVERFNDEAGFLLVIVAGFSCLLALVANIIVYGEHLRYGRNAAQLRSLVERYCRFTPSSPEDWPRFFRPIDGLEPDSVDHNSFGGYVLGVLGCQQSVHAGYGVRRSIMLVWLCGLAPTLMAVGRMRFEDPNTGTSLVVASSVVYFVWVVISFLTARPSPAGTSRSAAPGWFAKQRSDADSLAVVLILGGPLLWLILFAVLYFSAG